MGLNKLSLPGTILHICFRPKAMVERKSLTNIGINNEKPKAWRYCDNSFLR